MTGERFLHKAMTEFAFRMIQRVPPAAGAASAAEAIG
jgi:hypothetical protein